MQTTESQGTLPSLYEMQILTRLKCDEARPRCTYCGARNLQCIYPHRAEIVKAVSESSDAELVVTSVKSRCLGYTPYQVARAINISNTPNRGLSFSNLNLTDLCLMNHFSNVISDSLITVQKPGADRLMKYELPRLALQHDFVMHCVLGIASLHLRSQNALTPELQSQTVAHRINAISGLRSAISSISKDNSQAILATSLFVIILGADRASSPPDQLWIASWFGLWAGMREMIRQISWGFLANSGLAPLFARDDRPMTDLINLPVPLTGLLATLDPDDESSMVVTKAAYCLSKLYESLLFDNFNPDFAISVVGWPANIDVAQFHPLLRRLHPQALIIAAYYLVFTKLSETNWWMVDVTDPEIEAIAAVVPTEFQSFMAGPLEAVQLSNKQDIANLLVSQLPANSTFKIDIEEMRSGDWWCGNFISAEDMVCISSTADLDTIPPLLPIINK
jgi:hypothetical protein